MKLLTQLAYGVFIIVGSCAGLSQASTEVVAVEKLVADKGHRQAAMLMTKVNEKFHYRKLDLDDKFSAAILEEYLTSLDPNRSFFLQTDVDAFHKYRTSIDDDLKGGELGSAFMIFRVFRQRVSEQVTYALTLIGKDFDFDKKENYLFNRKEAAWAKNRDELNELWRKRIKNDTLSLILADKETDKIKETLVKRYQGVLRRTEQMNADDVFQVFANAYTGTLEPHTGYMSPRSSENFDISMRLSLEGIGAVLKTVEEYTVVQRTVPGGPAAVDGQLKSKDKIVGVAQGKDGEMLDVVGWRLQDVVEKIRGPKDSVVRLKVLPKSSGGSGPTTEVLLVRNKVKLEDQAAKSSIIDSIKGLSGKRIGVIDLPTFYRDFRGQTNGDKEFRSTTRDVKKLLVELQKEHVDGVVIDLRGNGGGALTEAVELTGLFIESGPVVQVKNASGVIEIEEDTDPEQVYKGPLAVLVDRNSASASEIFAGAIQDYKRGIVLGEPTYGKGTVQTLVDLDNIIGGSDLNMGRMRLTMAQFFRVNGGSTQYKGVVPDIIFPTVIDISDQGERALENALPWDHIKPANYQTAGLGAFSRLIDKHDERVLKDPGFSYLLSLEKALVKLQDSKSVSLNKVLREQEWNQRKHDRLVYRNIYRTAIGLDPLENEDDAESYDDPKDDPEQVRAIELNEAARILADYIKSTMPPSLTAMNGSKLH